MTTLTRYLRKKSTKQTLKKTIIVSLMATFEASLFVGITLMAYLYFKRPLLPSSICRIAIITTTFAAIGEIIVIYLLYEKSWLTLKWKTILLWVTIFSVMSSTK